MKACLLSAALIAIAATTPAHASDTDGASGATSAAASTPDYEGEARRIIEGLHATGMVGAVMIDGEVAFTGAFGTVEEGSGQPITNETLFPIASISKAFTTTALAILVDRGQLAWDDPVRKYIPEFAMYDPWVSEHFTVRDLLTHRSGLPLGAGDLLIWPDGGADASDIIAALPHLRPTTGFRDGYAYDNLLYIVAGEVLHRISGKTWQDFVTDEIFEPVGLTECAADGTRIRPGQSVVRGHERAAGALTGVPIDKRLEFAPEVAAAGGIWCPAGDMMKWAKFWLDGGVTSGGVRLISEKQKNEVWKGVTPVGSGIIRASGGSTNLALYALGWFVRDLEGTPMVTHSGGAPGVASNFILLPQRNVAIFASGNDYMATASSWSRQIADDLVGGRNVDVIAKDIADNDEMNAEAKKLVAEAVAPPMHAAKASLPLAAYVGTYRDPWYGEVTIRQKGGRLYIDMSKSEVLDGPLTHFDGDVFAAIWPDSSLKADAFVTFAVEGGKVTGMTMKAISEITDFSFDFHDLHLVRE